MACLSTVHYRRLTCFVSDTWAELAHNRGNGNRVQGSRAVITGKWPISPGKQAPDWPWWGEFREMAHFYRETMARLAWLGPQGTRGICRGPWEFVVW